MPTNRATELRSYIGRQGLFGVYGPGGGIDFGVEVIDARNRFGNLDFLIRPTTGEGSLWVSSSRVSLYDKPTGERRVRCQEGERHESEESARHG